MRHLRYSIYLKSRV